MANGQLSRLITCAKQNADVCPARVTADGVVSSNGTARAARVIAITSCSLEADDPRQPLCVTANFPALHVRPRALSSLTAIGFGWVEFQRHLHASLGGTSRARSPGSDVFTLGRPRLWRSAWDSVSVHTCILLRLVCSSIYHAYRVSTTIASGQRKK